MATCYRHPKEETGVSCSSCGRPICTECMTPTNVGMRCPECSKQKTKVRTAASTFAGSEPRVTYAIIAINAVVFLLMLAQGGTGMQTRVGWIYDHGYLAGIWVDQGEWWRLVTAGFMHDGSTHILFNMLAVFFLGRMLESELGSVRFAGIYFASLLAGSFGALLLSPEAATVGASGAVFGLFGAAVVFMRRQGINPLQSIIGVVLVLNLLVTFANRDTISVGGHLGGLVGGGLCALAILAAQDRRSSPLGIAGMVAIGVVSVVGGIWAAGTPSLY